MKEDKATDVFIVPAINQPLSAVQHHADIDGLERQLFCSELLHQASPAHIAVHTFRGGKRRVPGRFTYTGSHAHRCWEIDLVIPEGPGFLFQLETTKGITYLRKASTIVIPPGAKHRMEFVRGKGRMICIVLALNYGNSLIKRLTLRN